MTESQKSELSLILTPDRITKSFRFNENLLTDQDYLDFKNQITSEVEHQFYTQTITAFQKNDLLKVTCLVSYSFLFQETIVEKLRQELYTIFQSKMEAVLSELKKDIPYSQKVHTQFFKSKAFFDILDFLSVSFPSVFDEQFSVFRKVNNDMNENESFKMIKFQEKIQLNTENSSTLKDMLSITLAPRQERREKDRKKEIAIGSVAIILFFVIRIIIRIANHS